MKTPVKFTVQYSDGSTEEFLSHDDLTIAVHHHHHAAPVEPAAPVEEPKAEKVINKSKRTK